MASRKEQWVASQVPSSTSLVEFTVIVAACTVPICAKRGIGSAANIRVPILKKEPTEVDRQALFFIWWRRGREPVFTVPVVWGSSFDDDGGDGLRNCFTPIDD